MTQRQKRFLIIFGITDLLVIVLLFGVVFYSRQATPRPTPTLVTPIAVCPRQVLDTLPPLTYASIIWEEDQLQLSLYLNYATATPPDDSAQYLWLGLDSIAGALSAECPAPATITINVTARGVGKVHRHQTQISGQTVAAWANHALEDTDLIDQAQYRRITP
ncbi:MAG TPA: hypothetical protein PKH77_15595 [Anaerolineae bacterium]|nr:hypothetical protein [Anaerolineae bacterium]